MTKKVGRVALARSRGGGKKKRKKEKERKESFNRMKLNGIMLLH